ncbi:MAG TPA: glycogen synthase GlgA, partial [Gemmataceae bacterium]|nr:glycogen synthase GlgA [Gemmataceae bacterium]
MRLLLAASEVVGFAKTGGLADVAGALPRALRRRGHDCAVILPLYRAARAAGVLLEPTSHILQVPVGGRPVAGRLWRSTLPGCDVPAFLVEQSYYFERDDPAQGRGLYQFTLPGGKKQDYPDNCERFVFFSRAVLEAVRLLDYWPDVLHANDWQTGLVPVYLREVYQRQYAWVSGTAYDRIRTLFTIHNIAYQGVFWHWDMKLTGLDWRLFNYRQLEFHGHLNLLKAGIVFADVITTVSPSYAREIQTPYYGCGLQGVLAERKDRLYGIVNGADYDHWDPATDPHLAANYDVETVAQKKPLCKAALQRRFGLPEEPRAPLLGMVARLVEQKGVDLVIRAAGALFEQGAQLVVLGEGEPIYHRRLQELQAQYPDRLGLALTFDEPLAHQIEAGADLFLMPSLYEPSGLNQLYSMKYGTPPVVRATGGLADTVVDCTPETLAAGTATGFCFVPHTPDALVETVRRALDLYHHHPDQWLQVQQTGMRQDWSWDRSAAEYERLYQS